MSRKQFTTEVRQTERGQVSIAVPFDPVEVWGKRPRHFVKGTLEGAPFRGSLGTKGGAYFMPVNKLLQKASGVTPGQFVRVVMESDEAEKAELPKELQVALAKSKKARTFFDTLSSFYRNSYVKWIESAKQPETRAARVEKTVLLLEAHKKQK